MEIEKTVSAERARGDCYRFLSACFCLPQKESFVQESVLKNLTNALTWTCSEAVGFSSEMERAFLETDEEELKVEYARLFLGPYELKAPPYGSIYLDGVRRLMGNSTLEVIRLYDEAGLVLDEGFKGVPDHISVELEFMYYLISKEAEALGKSEKEKALGIRETKNDFFNRLLSPWVPDFCQKMRESTENFFYKALGDCLSAFITNQRNIL